MQTTIKLIVFIVASAELFHISRPSLRNARSHGYYRFIAWESVLLLSLANGLCFFRRPSSMHQILALVCVWISATLAIHGFWLLYRVGRPRNQRSGPELLWVERTTVLVSVGAYQYVRHPLYCSFLVLTWGVYSTSPSYAGAALALLATICVIVAAKVEERENLEYFGDVYAKYMTRTKMFIPGVI
jgi:protein-S-isoprenylcysteine O-methyltransferase Ste14